MADGSGLLLEGLQGERRFASIPEILQSLRDNRPPAAVWGEMEAFELLMETEDFEEAVSLSLGAHTLLDRWGFGRYLENQYSRLLNEVNQAMVGKLVHNRGLLLQNRAEYDVALEAHKKSMEISQFHDDRATVADSLYNIGIIRYLHGEYREALKAYKKSLEITEILGNHATVVSCLNQIGMIHRAHGEYKAALEAYQNSWRFGRPLATAWGWRRRAAKSVNFLQKPATTLRHLRIYFLPLLPLRNWARLLQQLSTTCSRRSVQDGVQKVLTRLGRPQRVKRYLMS